MGFISNILFEKYRPNNYKTGFLVDFEFSKCIKEELIWKTE